MTTTAAGAPGWGVVGRRLWLGPRRGYGGWGYDGPWVENETRIAVDLFDAKSHKAIWHGAVSQTASDLTGPNARGQDQCGRCGDLRQIPGRNERRRLPPSGTRRRLDAVPRRRRYAASRPRRGRDATKR